MPIRRAQSTGLAGLGRKPPRVQELNLGRLRGGFGAEFQHLGAHLFSRFEFHDGTFGDRHVGLRCVRVAADACFADFHFENAKVAQLHFVAFSQGFGNVIERFLDDIQYLLLNKTRLIADPGNQISLCQGHTYWFCKVRFT